MKLSGLKNYFTGFEIALWVSSVILIVVSFLFSGSGEFLNLIASLVGVTSIILCAKGNPNGLLIMILFSILYGTVSFAFAYYGETITYLGMSAPMSVVAYIAWKRNSYKAGKPEVKVGTLERKHILTVSFLAVPVTVFFYFILKYFNNANLIPSTLSVTTSFVAAYFSFVRSPLFALAYAVNDAVLIVLWILATMVDVSYISVIVCFIVFLVNDLYSFCNWCRMAKRQMNQP